MISNKLVCDNCQKSVDKDLENSGWIGIESGDPDYLERVILYICKKEGVIVADKKSRYDFCSLSCLREWFTKLYEKHIPSDGRNLVYDENSIPNDTRRIPHTRENK